MALRDDDLAILSARFGVARFGASRFGFCPDDVEGTGATEPGEYIWKEHKPPTTLWTLQSIFSHCGERPVAAFTDLPDPSAADEDVQFTDTSTPTAYISFWQWDFGDGETSNDQNPVHAYSTNGEYTVTLYVAGIRGSASTTGTHTVCGESLPVAGFTWETNGGSNLDFTDTSTGTIDSWLWDFAGEATSTEQNPSYDFGDYDPHTVTLTVTNCAGSDQDQNSVQAIGS